MTTTTKSEISSLLDDIDAYLAKYVCFVSDEQRHAVALWIAHTHVYECFHATPRLALLSPEKQSGKTRTLELLDNVCCRPLQAASISAAGLYSAIDELAPTVLIDEIDTVYCPGNGGQKEPLRAVLNAGYKSGSKVYRKSKDGLVSYDVFAPVALAGIGADVLPDTVSDRSIHIRMKRKPLDVELQTYNAKRAKLEGVELHTFSVDKTVYALDLSAENYGKLLDALKPFIDAAAKVGSVAAAPAKKERAPRGSKPKVERAYEPAQVREWQAATGRPVSKARFPDKDIADYLASQGKG